jgi:hypothetical protein
MRSSAGGGVVRRAGGGLAEGAVRPVGVVVIYVDREYVVELPVVDNQDPIEELAAEAGDPLLGDRIGSRRPDRGAHDLDASGGEDGVERGGELTVAVADQVVESAALSARSISRFRAHWATQGPVGWAVTPSSQTCRVDSSTTKNTYRRPRSTVSTWAKSQARIVSAWNCRQL